ncbi:transposase, partial [Psychromarinibacter sp. C21-152]
VISRLTGEWQQEYDRWQRRDLSARRYVYIWADGVYLQARMEAQAECMLVILGATPEGKKELVGFQVGVRESAQSWRELLVDIKARGLKVLPEIAVGDGGMGFWKALDEV